MRATAGVIVPAREASQWTIYPAKRPGDYTGYTRARNPRSEPEIDFQPAALLAMNEIEETLRRGIQLVGDHGFYLCGW